MREFRDTRDRVGTYRRTRGRPHRLTPALADAIVDGVRAGLSIARAVQLAGVGRSTVYRNATLMARIERASAEIEVELVTRLRAAAIKPRGWRSAAWWLEHRHPDRWGQRKGPRAPEAPPAPARPSNVYRFSPETLADPIARASVDALLAIVGGRLPKGV
jgi:hypothetical protein